MLFVLALPKNTPALVVFYQKCSWNRFSPRGNLQQSAGTFKCWILAFHVKWVSNQRENPKRISSNDTHFRVKANWKSKLCFLILTPNDGFNLVRRCEMTASSQRLKLFTSLWKLCLQRPYYPPQTEFIQLSSSRKWKWFLLISTGFISCISLIITGEFLCHITWPVGVASIKRFISPGTSATNVQNMDSNFSHC